MALNYVDEPIKKVLTFEIKYRLLYLDLQG